MKSGVFGLVFFTRMHAHFEGCPPTGVLKEKVNDETSGVSLSFGSYHATAPCTDLS